LYLENQKKPIGPIPDEAAVKEVIMPPIALNVNPFRASGAA